MIRYSEEQHILGMFLTQIVWL